jgi:hypothetical protein
MRDRIIADMSKNPRKPETISSFEIFKAIPNWQ